MLHPLFFTFHLIHIIHTSVILVTCPMVHLATWRSSNNSLHYINRRSFCIISLIIYAHSPVTQAPHVHVEIIQWTSNKRQKQNTNSGQTGRETTVHTCYISNVIGLHASLPKHVTCTFVASLPVTPRDSSLHHFLSQSVTMYSARAVTFSFWTL